MEVLPWNGLMYRTSYPWEVVPGHGHCSVGRRAWTMPKSFWMVSVAVWSQDSCWASWGLAVRTFFLNARLNLNNAFLGAGKTSLIEILATKSKMGFTSGSV